MERRRWPTRRAIRRIAWGAALALVWGQVAPGAAAEAADPKRESNACVDCHWRQDTLRQFPTWTRDHFAAWYAGAHGRAGVACNECHGGDPGASDAKAAHSGMIPSSEPTSAVHYKNLPKTCGRCHEAVYKEFARSHHYKQLISDQLAPTCTTCHGFQMDVDVPTHSIVERCTICHHAGKDGVRPEEAKLASAALDHVAKARQAVEKARWTIELARDQGRDTSSAEALLRGAEERLERTGSLWHRFQMRAFERELSQIRAEAEESQEKALRSIVTP